MTTITVRSPVKVVPPPAARWAAIAFMRVVEVARRVSAARLERRLEAERMGDAAALRRYAMRFSDHDPRFTADLMAAADRHEHNA